MARRLFKVQFELDPSDWHGVSGERLWAAPATDPGTIELQNSPFHKQGVSYLDIVAARPKTRRHSISSGSSAAVDVRLTWSF
jgi:hypothetical protein